MIKGCQKKIILLKNTGSDFFEEAYFILKDGALPSSATENDMIREASRIISESQLSSYCAKTRSRGIRQRIAYCLLGAGGCGAFIGFLVWLGNLIG